MSAFIDDFYNDDLHNLNKLKAMLNYLPNIQEDYDYFIIYFKDLEASINNHIHLTTLDVYMPIRDINIMIERMNHKEALCVSKYGIYRDCENYLVHTDWFFNLPACKQYEIRFDFYSTIVLGIREAFYR
jgi:hypothetical protein